MKSITFVLFAAVFVSLVTFVVCEDYSDFEKACMKELNVPENELTAFFVGGMKPADTKDNTKCFIKCVMEKEGYMKGGQFLDAPTIKSFKEDPDLKGVPVEKIVTDCKNEKGANDCDTAFKIMMCWAKNKIDLH